MSNEDANDGVTIRAAGLSDLSAINDLYLEYSIQLQDPTQRAGDNPTLLAWQMKRLRQELMANQSYYPFLVQRADQSLAGYCAVLIKENSPAFALPIYADISEFHVTDCDDRRELSRRLLETVLSFLETRGIDHVTTTTSDELVESMLGSRGFSAVSRVMYLDLATISKERADEEDG